MTGAVQGQRGKLLRESLDALVGRDTAMSAAFFEALVAAHSEFRELFAHVELPAQHASFTAALNFVASHYEERPALERCFRELGARHAGYGVRPEHFAVFGACLLDTMAQFAGPGWTLAVELAWRTAFEDLAELMLDGAAQAQAPESAQTR